MFLEGGGRGPRGGGALVYTHTATHGNFEIGLYTVVYGDVMLLWVYKLVNCVILVTPTSKTTR